MNSSTIGIMPSRNVISVSTSFNSSAFLDDNYLSFLILLLSFFGNSTSINLLTAPLIFTSHPHAGIGESQQL